MKRKFVLEKNSEGKRIHVIGHSEIECSGQGCPLCSLYREQNFMEWENSIPFPIPPKGKRYKGKLVQQSRGKTIMEICHTCPEAFEGIPCYLCRRAKCDKWMKEASRRGKEQGCASWWKDKCREFSCKLNLIKTRWE